MPDYVMSLKGVKKAFGNKDIINSLDLDIEKNEIIGLIGVSGSGKTTLLNMLIGFYAPDEGEISFLPTKVPNSKLLSFNKNVKLAMHTIGFAPQIPSFYPTLTSYENLDYFSSLYGIEEKTRKNTINSLLSLVELSNCSQLKAKEMSLGMQKRLGIACSMVHNPDLIILDEPTADLDPHLRKQLLDVIRDIHNEGKTIIIASHFIEEIENVCTKVAILHEGKIAEYLSVEDLKKKYAKSTVVEIESKNKKYDKQSLVLKKVTGVKRVLIESGKIRVFTLKPKLALKKLISSIGKENLVSYKVEPPTLSDVFEHITSKKVQE